MAVELQFLDMDNQPIDLSSGLDYGLVRKGRPSITPVKIKNVGDITAKDLIISASTLNDKSEVSEDEYVRQLLGASWKTFGLEEDGEFFSELDLGAVRPNEFVQGTKTIHEKFESDSKCIFKEAWSTGITEFNNKMVFRKLDNEAKGNISKRMDSLALGRPVEVDIEFSLDPLVDSSIETDTDGMIVFPVRIGSNGDGRGYLFLVQYRRTDNRFFVAINKGGRGIVTNVDRDYGTKIMDTITYKLFDKNKKIGLRVYNNASGYPTFEVRYDGQKILLADAIGGAEGLSLSDTRAGAYRNGGQVFMDMSMYDGDISYTISDMTIKVDDLEKPIYIKTTLGDDAQNGVEYKSSAIVSYIEG